MENNLFPELPSTWDEPTTSHAPQYITLENYRPDTQIGSSNVALIDNDDTEPPPKTQKIDPTQNFQIVDVTKTQRSSQMFHIKSLIDDLIYLMVLDHRQKNHLFPGKQYVLIIPNLGRSAPRPPGDSMTRLS